MWYYIYKHHGIRRTKGQKKKCIYLFAVFLIVCFSVLGLGSTVRAAEDSLEYMYIRATDFPEGDLTRLANVLRKAQRGEEVTIGFIGGSITEGYDASSKDNSYVSLVYKWWCEAFPLTKVNLVNAGVGGTSSYLGVHRVGEDMLSHNPDLVFIEFAVNDTHTELCRNSYENLLRQILGAEMEPAVVLLFSVNAYGDSVQPVEAELGEYYRVPMISYGNAVMPEMAAGSFAWWQITSDVVHPNDMGHAIYAGLITKYLEAVHARLGSIPEVSDWTMPEAVTPQIFTGAHIENAGTLLPATANGFQVYDFNRHFGNNWYATEDNAYILFFVRASEIGIMYQRTVEGTFGQYDVYLDGQYVKTLDGNYIEGYGTETDVEQIYSSPEHENRLHILKIEKSPFSINTDFVVVGLLIT